MIRHYLKTLAVLILLCGKLHAATERIITSRAGVLSNPIAVNGTMLLQDQWYSYMQANPSLWSNTFFVASSDMDVMLRYDDKLRYGNPNIWALTVTYDLTTYDASGTAVTYSGQTLAINYDPQAGIKITDRIRKRFTNVHKAELKITAIDYDEVTVGNVIVVNNGTTVPTALNDIYLDLELTTERYYILNTATVPTLQRADFDLNADSNPDEIELQWNFIQGAESYDVEWLFVDAGNQALSNAFDFDFKNAVRVNVPTQHYRITLAYPKGILLYRVRGVGMDDANYTAGNGLTRIEGAWSYSTSSGTTTTVSGNSVRLDISTGLHPDMNWSYSVGFAEDGKKGESMSFMDASLKGRQAITRVNSDETLIIGESKMDHFGRPMLSIMPYPLTGTDNTGFHYYPDQHPSLDNRDNIADDTHLGNPVSLGGSDASNKYYSSATTSGKNPYTPDAGGKPYGYVTYKNDGTGRTSTASSVGENIGAGSGKETKYFYGTPTGQDELDRLFGNEVGFVKHYKKNFVVDANGQTSIVYLDQEGRTIATALAGEVPANLTVIDDQQGRLADQTLSGDLLGNNNTGNTGDVTSVSTLTVTSNNSLYSFQYDLSAATCFTYNCTELCPDCLYDIEICIVEEDGTPVDLDPSTNANCLTATGVSSQTFTFNITLNVGVYRVTKVLRLNPASYAQAMLNFKQAQGGEGSCVPEPEPIVAPCASNCDQACELAFTTGYDESSQPYYINEEEQTITGQDRLDLIAECQATLCDQPAQASSCDEKLAAMKNDMSPGGQYFDNHPAQFLTGTGGDQYPNPNWNDGNMDINDWLNTYFRDEAVSGFSAWFSGLVAGSCGAVTVNNWNEVRANWQPCWAEELVKHHPEHCAWEYFCDRSCSAGGSTLNAADFADYYNLIFYNTTGEHPSGSSGNQDLFNPLGITPATACTTWVERNAYQPNAQPSAGNLDPLLRCDFELCEDPSVSSQTAMTNYLNNYLRAYDASGTYLGTMSIWYVLDDPENIHAGTPPFTLAPELVDYFQLLHGDGTTSGLIGTGAGQITAYQYFKSSYLFYRDLIVNQGFWNNTDVEGCQASQLTGYSGKYTNEYLTAGTNNSSTTPDGFIIYYPQPAIYALYGDGCSAPDYDAITEAITELIDDASADPVTLQAPQGGACACENLAAYITEGGFSPTDYTGIAAALQAEFGGTITATNVNDWLNNATWGCSATTPDLVTMQTNAFPVDMACVLELPEISATAVEDECNEEATLLAQNNANQYFQQQLAIAEQNYSSGLINHCMNGLADRESFTVSYKLKEYYYTLYYYDQAGNLIKTVLPEGVNIITNTVTLTAVKDYRNEVSGSTFTPAVHDMLSIYKYNSMQQTTEATSTDGGKSTYWYDYLGRLIVSQNAKQASSSNFSPLAYSYTQYDALGRIDEVGQVQSSSPMSDDISRQSGNYYYYENVSPTTYENWLTAAAASKRQVTKTWYDEAMTAVHTDVTTAFGSGGQKNLRNRVAAVQFDDDPSSTAISSIYDPGNTPTGQKDYQHAQHYSYDIHGNVNIAISETPALEAIQQHIKKTTYNYDLISGNVNEVHYQSGAFDQFHHKYEYDADNRLTVAYSSKDNVHWEKESKQFYYLHGGASRVEIGDKIVQGADFVYTLQGWLKGVNRNTLGGTGNAYAMRDIGLDAVSSGSNINRNVGSDAYGFTLGYYKAGTGDYNPIVTPTSGNNFEAATSGSDFRSASVDQYNGNISNAVYAITKSDQSILEHQGSTYKYDQLYRLKQVNTWHNIDLATNAWNSGSTNDLRYKEYFSYDFNGNITRAKRYSGTTVSGTATIMDSLAYYYNKTGGTYDASTGSPSDATNKLNYITDNITSDCSFAGDLDNHGHNNYLYDEIGQLLKDGKEYITSIEWTPYQKVSKVIKDNSVKTDPCTSQPLVLQDLEFWYDASGARLCKIVKPHKSTGGVSDQNEWIYTWYSYDASGNVMAVYEQTHEFQSGSTYKAKYNVEEHDVYGGGRLGIRHGDVADKYECNLTASINGSNGLLDAISWSTCTAPIPPHGNNAEYKRTLGEKQYELSNHLGNVIVTVSDKRIPIAVSGNPTILAFYSADVLSHTDYYAFGGAKVDRSGAQTEYRYGFNGKEGDDEITGDEGSYDFGARIYDSRVGRFLSRDPKARVYAMLTPYCFAADNPITFIDENGEGPIVHQVNNNTGNLMIILADRLDAENWNRQQELGNWDIVVVTDLKDAADWLDKNYKKGINNLYWHAHGELGGGMINVHNSNWDTDKKQWEYDEYISKNDLDIYLSSGQVEELPDYFGKSGKQRTDFVLGQVKAIDRIGNHLNNNAEVTMASCLLGKDRMNELGNSAVYPLAKILTSNTTNRITINACEDLTGDITPQSKEQGAGVYLDEDLLYVRQKGDSYPEGTKKWLEVTYDAGEADRKYKKGSWQNLVAKAYPFTTRHTTEMKIDSKKGRFNKKVIYAKF